MSLDGTEWQILIPAETFRSLRREESFRQITALGRTLNSLRIAEFALLDAPADRPAGARQRIGAFFLFAAFSHEAFELLQRMAKYFRNTPVWKERIAPVLADPLFRRLSEKSLAVLRDQAVFHFFEDALATPLEHCDLEEVPLISGFGPEQGEVFYELSDLMALALFIDEHSSVDEQLRRAETLMTQTRDLMLAIIEAGEALIAEYAKTQGFEAVKKDGPHKGAA
jgi:hypothetical protein